MLELQFNKDKITFEELNEIEKRFEQCLREKITPEFNVLNLSRTDLYAHILSIFIRLQVHKQLDINISQMLDFLIDVAEKYTDEAPYHTIYHAADIVTVLYYVCHELNANKRLTDLDVTFLMVAALCHDAGHPGLNNGFQSKLNSPLIKKYGEASVLETYSVDLTIQLLKKHNIQKNNNEMIEIIQDLILSTDMTYHSELEKQSKELSNIKNYKKKDRMSLCRILLHTADISNMARPWLISKQWSDLIVKEFFLQGDEEKKRNMTISPGMDRTTNSQKDISLKFGETILPFFISLIDLLPKTSLFVDFLQTNRGHWESLHNKKRPIRRVSSDIYDHHSYLPTTTNMKFQPMKYKRIRLGFRSQSYPTVLYHHHTHRNHHHHHCNSNIIEKPNHSNLLLAPLIAFKSTCLYDNPNNIESIVLYHPYDK